MVTQANVQILPKSVRIWTEIASFHLVAMETIQLYDVNLIGDDGTYQCSNNYIKQFVIF